MSDPLPLQVSIPTTSRYRNTRLYDDQDLGQRYFGIWRAPKIIENNPVSLHRVSIEEQGRPDLIAYRVYGNPSWFWVISSRNGILLPIRELTTGMLLVCPHKDDVVLALGTSNANNYGTY